MWLSRLRVAGVRNLTEVDVTLGPGINLFLGGNGAGKTSLLEAVHCLGNGRSFRGGGRADYLNRETRRARIIGNVVGDNQETWVVGLERDARAWRARIDGVGISKLSELARALPVLSFHPRMHELIEGPPEERRKFLDFGVFHVEQTFHVHWRDYKRALVQRNAVLRNRSLRSQSKPWERELAMAGQLLSRARERYLVELSSAFSAALSALDPSLGPIALVFRQGWPDGEDLNAVLRESYASDLEAGYTRAGPHRADLRLDDANGSITGRLSRGQQKLVALALTLAQARLLAQDRQHMPIIGLDDLSSELDTDRQRQALKWLVNIGIQVLVSGTEIPEGWSQITNAARVFHVEHGRISEEPSRGLATAQP